MISRGVGWSGSGVGWHKRPAEMYLPVLQEREPDQVTSREQSLL